MTTVASNPYSSLPEAAFWRTAVADRSYFDLADLWTPKFAMGREDRFATFGSCFAQHIGRALVGEGFGWLVTERAPQQMTAESARRFGYDVFTCRTGNIYTTSQLRQWTHWSLGSASPPDEHWASGDRIIDPFRPRIEPDGFGSPAEMRRSREVAVRAFADAIRTATVFVFTLGLTESWFHRDGHEYPICPGTAGGAFDPGSHRFVNQGFREVASELEAAIDGMRQLNPTIRVLLTVSPVPLTATASGQHSMVATMRSKSVLRAVAAELAERDPLTDYFPSYEIIASPPARAAFFEPNLRSVNPYGVSFVMGHFFRGVGHTRSTAPASPADPVATADAAELVCEEELLSAFGDRP